MTFLPIVERELRVAARRRQTFWVRLAMAGLGLLVGGYLLLVGGWFATPQRLGQQVFAGLTWVVFLYALLAGLWTTADSLSQEKRAGTLGLLFLTDLKGYDIVLGKLAATSLNALTGFLAVLPIMAVPLMLGSVAGGQVLRVAVAALNALFFSLSTGLLASALCRDERRALGLCLALLFGLTLGWPALGGLLAMRLNWSEPLRMFLLPSPGFSCLLAFEPMMGVTGRTPTLFPWSLAVVHGLSWLFLALACWLAPRAWQERATVTPTRPWWRRWREWVQGSPEARRRFRARGLSENPFYWLAARDRSRPVMLWLFLGISALLWAWGWATYQRYWLHEGTYIFTGLALNTLLKWWLAGEAAWRFSQDRQSGALELVLGTPLKVREIIAGQETALWRLFGLPVTIVVGVELLFLSTSPERDWIAVWTAGILMLLADLLTLSWVGMWLGLTRPQQGRAVGLALAWVCVLPWGLFLGVIAVAGTTGVVRLWRWNEETLPLVWLAIGLGVDTVLGGWARTSLFQRFRAVVTERGASRPGQA